MITYASYRLAAFLSRRLPRRWLYRLARDVADLFYAADRRGRTAVQRNLSVILQARGERPDDAELSRMARQTFRNFGKYVADFFRYSLSTADEVARIVRCEHEEYIDAALAPGKGVLVVSAHVGNWELGGMLWTARGRRLNAVALPQRLRNVNRLFQEQRASRGLQVLPLGRAAARVLECLRRGEAVALLADRDVTPRSVTVPFFGSPARLPSGPVRLAVKSGAPLLPGFVLRQPDDTFVLRYYPPLAPEGRAAEPALQARLARILEEVIGAQPHQWFMFRDFWSESETPLEP